MKKQPRTQENIRPAPSSDSMITLHKKRFLWLLDNANGQKSLSSLRKKTLAIRQIVSDETGSDKLFSDGANGSAISLRRDVLVSELDQVLEAQTIERAKHYLKILAGGVRREKRSAVNDINLSRWKEYEEVLTDSLWNLPKRDTAGAHLGWYWGNFIPQIPRQLLLRYTKKNDWVLDTFLGSGTTLIECRRMGRNGIGIELNPQVARKARELINRESNPDDARTEIIRGDSKTINIGKALERVGVRQVQLLVMHPPYHDIITFSESKKDLSTAESAGEFLKMFGEVLDNVTPVLERGRYFALVIGDKYEKGEWVPLGFECMKEVLKREYSLKSIIVKNFEETRAKRDQKQLWRYRALVGGFYIFKHEYIFLFRKR